MTYREMLLEDLKEGPVRFYGKPTVERRIDLLHQLESENLITMELVACDDQESYLLVQAKTES